MIRMEAGREKRLVSYRDRRNRWLENRALLKRALLLLLMLLAWLPPLDLLGGLRRTGRLGGAEYMPIWSLVTCA